MKLSIVTVTHNSGHVLEEFSRALAIESVGSEVELVLVDSGSLDPSEVARAAERVGARFLDVGKNIGYGAGSNLGAASRDAEWVAFVNPDVSTSASNLLRLCEIAETHGLAVIGPRIRLSSGEIDRNRRGLIRPPWRREISYERTSNGEVDLTGSVSGCCLLVRADAFRDVGGFDPRFFMFAEEIDLQARLRKQGHSVGVAAGLFVETPGGGSSLGVTTRWAEVQRSASHVLYVEKHFTRWEGKLDYVWRAILVVRDSRHQDRRASLRQLRTEVAAGRARAAKNSA